jgi:molybdate transport repressor ModE-like protein
MSYRYVWNYIQKIHSVLGESVVETYKGGKAGGGGASLTEKGKSLLEEYTRLEGCLSEFLAGAKTMGGERLEIKRKKSSQRKSSGS